MSPHPAREPRPYEMPNTKTKLKKKKQAHLRAWARSHARLEPRGREEVGQLVTTLPTRDHEKKTHTQHKKRCETKRAAAAKPSQAKQKTSLYILTSEGKHRLLVACNAC